MSDYREPGRTYGSVGLLAALFVVGFLIDLGLGGGVAHLPGWIIAFVIVVGIDVFVVWAARSTHTLTVDADEVRVGDDVLRREDIAAAVRGVDRSLPVLGWTITPHVLRGVTVRLVDGRDVVVPTRHADRVEAALGLGGAVLDEVRPADDTDLELLPEIDERADVLFRTAGYAVPEIPFRADELADAQAVFVAGRPPVAFALVTEVDGDAHLAEIAVLPGHMRRGIGTRLLQQACDWAGERGYPAITLTTYADIAWNGPFYAAHGFVETDDLTPGLAAQRAWEGTVGLDEVGRRIVMRRAL